MNLTLLSFNSCHAGCPEQLEVGGGGWVEVAMHHLSLTVWSVQLESLGCAGVARADKGLI